MKISQDRKYKSLVDIGHYEYDRDLKKVSISHNEEVTIGLIHEDKIIVLNSRGDRISIRIDIFKEIFEEIITV